MGVGRKGFFGNKSSRHVDAKLVAKLLEGKEIWISSSRVRKFVREIQQEGHKLDDHDQNFVDRLMRKEGIKQQSDEQSLSRKERKELEKLKRAS